MARSGSTAGTRQITRTVGLVRRAQAGDRRALMQVIERYRERVRAIVRIRLGRRLRGVLAADDILQDTFAAALEQFDQFELNDEASLVHWLGKLAERRIEAAPERSCGVLARVDPEPESSGEAELLEACIQALPVDYRELILLRNYAGFSWRAVAKKCDGSSAIAARKMHAKAVVALGKMMHRKRDALARPSVAPRSR